MTWHQKIMLKIAKDTIKNPAKALLGFPSVAEAKAIVEKLRGKKI